MPSFFHLRDIEDFNFDTKFGERFSAARKFLRIKYIGRLVDEVARQYNTLSEGIGVGECFFDLSLIGHTDVDFGA